MLGQRAMICLQILQRTRLAPHETKMIGTGVALAVPEGYFGGVFFARSGLSARRDFVLPTVPAWSCRLSW